MIVADWNNLEQQTVSQWSSSQKDHQISGMSFSCAQHGCFKSLDLDRTSRPVRRCQSRNWIEAESASMAGRHGKSNVRFKRPILAQHSRKPWLELMTWQYQNISSISSWS